MDQCNRVTQTLGSWAHYILVIFGKYVYRRQTDVIMVSMQQYILTSKEILFRDDKLAHAFYLLSRLSLNRFVDATTYCCIMFLSYYLLLSSGVKRNMVFKCSHYNSPKKLSETLYFLVMPL